MPKHRKEQSSVANRFYDNFKNLEKVTIQNTLQEEHSILTRTQIVYNGCLSEKFGQKIQKILRDHKTTSRPLSVFNPGCKRECSIITRSPQENSS